jgi:D-alanyl-D-alanine carboxypeptidase/D-alanyl-D-alanine-endopeptidase (penicillin-binding protein 4)
MTRRGRARGAAPPLLALIALCAACAGPRPAVVPLPPVSPIDQLKGDVDTLLADPALQHATWGVLVKSLDSGDIVYALNSGKLLLPSSTMKILTLAAAAERLGWDFTYETLIVGDVGSFDTVGPLVVVGGGDPSIDDWDGAATRLFGGWAEELKAVGIRAIAGDIIGDDNAFDDEPLGAGWMWDDLDRSFATGIGALQFNENTAQLTIAPGSSVGEPARVDATPPAAGLIVRSRVTTAAAGSPPAIATERLPGREVLEVRGSVALGSAPVVRNVSVLNPTVYFVSELRAALVAHGIPVQGSAVDIDDVPSLAAAGRTLVRHQSPPLAELAGTMMKLSQNLYAETLLKTLGRFAATPTASGGIAAVRAVLSSWGVPDDGYQQADGSGLSRYNFVTPDTLVAVLTHLRDDARLRDPFLAALPVAGREGTLANRMNGTMAAGNARAKTGSMSNARALAGYVSTADGEPLVFAIIANNFGVGADLVEGAIDRIVVRLAEFARQPRGEFPATVR